MPFVSLKDVEHCARILTILPDVKYRGVMTSGWADVEDIPYAAGQYNEREKSHFLSRPELSIVAF